jgi:TonB-linked SusC/RagA family outer membrane protein
MPKRYMKIITTAVLMAVICTCGFSQAGNREPVEISGVITDGSTNVPLEGMVISIPDFSSTFTDSLGRFTLMAPHNESALLVSGPGYQSREVLLKGKQELSIRLNEQGFPSLDEKAKLFYSEKQLAYTAQSVVSLNVSDNTWRKPGTSAEKIINSEVPGLRILARSGVPGIGSNMFMRGFSSMYASNQPLIILDGMIYETSQSGTSIISGYQTNPLNSISTSDIENITVIRDAASIYGSRASNGILYIRTNHPYEMATRINFSMYGGMNYSPRQLPLLTSEDYRSYLAEILQTSGITADSMQSMPFMIDDTEFQEYYRYHNETNWQDEVFSNSTNQNINLKITGGDDIALYALSVGYKKHEGIVKKTNYSMYSFRFNSDINISQKLLLRTNLGFTFNQHNLKEDGDAPGTNPFHTSLVKAPFLFPRVRSYTGDISPNLEDADIFGVSNPTAIIQNLSATSNNYKILASVDVEYRLSDDFKANNYLGINFDKSRDNLFVPYLGIAADTIKQGVAGNKVAHMVERYFNVYNDFRLNYSKLIGWRHHINALAGTRLGINKTQGDWGMDYNTPNDQIRSLGNGVSSMREVDGFFGDWNWMTIYGMAEYDYNHRYLVNVNVGLDGSSRFGEEADGISMFGGKFGLFSSIAAAWLVSSEHFMGNIDFIDLFKIRVSYGITGNDNIGNYTATKFYMSQNFLGSQGLVMGNLYNPALQWETNKKANGGIDLAVYNHRLTFRIDLYRNRTGDMLNVIEANPLSGFDYYVDNSGVFTSTGADISLSGRIFNGSFKWDAGINLSKYKTKLIEFPEEREITTLYGANIISQVGKPINQFYGYKTVGVFSTQQEAEASGLLALMPNTDLIPFSAGDVEFMDKDNNDIIDENDMQVIGDPNPDLTGLFTSSISWKGITLDLGMSFSYGNDIFNHLRYRLESMQNADNQTEVALNRWRSDGQETTIPRATWGDPIGNSRFSDRWIEDGSYIRMSYVSLSYRFPVLPAFMNNLEIFLSAHNLFTITSYLGLDPDFSLSGSTLMQGIDLGLVPQPRSVYMGIRIGL